MYSKIGISTNFELELEVLIGTSYMNMSLISTSVRVKFIRNELSAPRYPSGVSSGAKNNSTSDKFNSTSK